MISEFPDGPNAQVALRLLLLSGLRRFREAGYGDRTESVETWMEALACTSPTAAAVLIYRVLFRFEEKKIAELLGYKGRSNINLFWQNAVRDLKDSPMIRRLEAEFGTPGPPAAKLRNRARRVG